MIRWYRTWRALKWCEEQRAEIDFSDVNVLPQDGGGIYIKVVRPEFTARAGAYTFLEAVEKAKAELLSQEILALARRRAAARKETPTSA